ncbi:MAG: HEAT repeat domain-containing protein [Thermomicrobiales bacterium]
MEDPSAEQKKREQAVVAAIEAIRAGEVSESRVTRLSDLSREGARSLATAWATIPEATREDLVKRFEELTEDRLDLDFGRALRVAIGDTSPVVRQLAVSALWEDESRDVLDRLHTLFTDDPSPDVRAAAAAGLERFAERAVAGDLSGEETERLQSELLGAASDERSPYIVRRRALEALGPLAGSAPVRHLITDAYESGDHGLQCSAIYAMGRSLDSRWLPIILAELEGEEPELRFEAARAAGALGAPDALPVLLAAAADEDAEVRHMAISAIGRIGGKGAVRALERLAEDAGEADLELIEAALDEANLMLEPFRDSS